MNTKLLESIHQADGRYLTDQELYPLEQYINSFATRVKTYSLLREQADALVLQTLRKLIQQHRKAVQENGKKCQRDMAYTLECIGRVILLDDSQYFQESYVIWMQNITRALHKQDSAVDAYRLLQAEISATQPAASAQLINAFLNQLIEAMTTGL